MGTPDDLITWLRGVLDEIEQVAQAAAECGHPEWRLFQPDPQYGDSRIEDGAGGVVVYDEGSPVFDESRHIVLHDPARVLRDVAAKRRILDDYAQLTANPGRRTDAALQMQWYLVGIVARVLASAYDNRPGWREEWRP